MNIFKRNQVVITALVIMIAIAGYLNFTQKNIPGADDMIETGSQYEAGAVVPNSDGDIEATFGEIDSEDVAEVEHKDDNENADTQETSQIDDTQPGEAIFTSNPISMNDYFITVRLNREQNRSQQKESYMAIINSTNLTEEEKKDAKDKLLNLQTRIENEAAAEDMLKAKGFNNVYVRINEKGTVDVVVGKQELSQADTAQINDVVKRTTGVEADKIVITPFKAQ